MRTELLEDKECGAIMSQPYGSITGGRSGEAVQIPMESSAGWRRRSVVTACFIEEFSAEALSRDLRGPAGWLGDGTCLEDWAKSQKPE